MRVGDCCPVVTAGLRKLGGLPDAGTERMPVWGVAARGETVGVAAPAALLLLTKRVTEEASGILRMCFV